MISLRFGIIRALTVVAMCTTGVSELNAHDIHTTFTSVATDATGTTLTVRSFADDFSASVARFHKRVPPPDSSVSAADAAAYAQATVRVVNSAGALVPMPSCGLRRERDLYFVCLRLPDVRNLSGWRIRNSMLTELHSDQVNIVQVQSAGQRRTLLFTRDGAPQMLLP